MLPLPEGASVLEKAILIAAWAHVGQTNPQGEPYILHPLRVMLRLDDDVQRAVAVLHDVVEDTDVEIADLARAGLPWDILDGVTAMTHRPDETYEDYIRRLSSNPIARRVKLSDLEGNMDVKSLPELTEKRHAKLKTYHWAWRFLNGVEAGCPAP